jgi:hypothetical protein
LTDRYEKHTEPCWGCDADDGGENSPDEQRKPHVIPTRLRQNSQYPYFISQHHEGLIAANIATLPKLLLQP